MPPQPLDRLGRVDKGYLVVVEVFRAELFEGQSLVDGFGGEEVVVEELGGAKEEGEELVVV